MFNQDDMVALKESTECLTCVASLWYRVTASPGLFIFLNYTGDYCEFSPRGYEGLLRIPSMWFTENTDKWEIASRVGCQKTEQEKLPTNNDGREYCFDSSCGGKVKLVPGILSYFGVCTRCGR